MVKKFIPQNWKKKKKKKTWEESIGESPILWHHPFSFPHAVVTNPLSRKLGLAWLIAVWIYLSPPPSPRPHTGGRRLIPPSVRPFCRQASTWPIPRRKSSRAGLPCSLSGMAKNTEHEGEEEEEEATSQGGGGGGHALAQQDEQRTSQQQQQTSRGGPMYSCMSNLTSAVVVGCWSTKQKQSKQNKANINRILLPQIKSPNARSYVYSLLQVMLLLMFTHSCKFSES